jgi:hypothetical protein
MIFQDKRQKEKDKSEVALLKDELRKEQIKVLKLRMRMAL